MKNLAIADTTLRVCSEAAGRMLGFREKIEISKLLDQLNVDVLETAPLENGKSDILFLHTVLSLVKNSVVSCSVKLDETAVETAWKAVSAANNPRIHILAPVSAAQMEYFCHRKPKFVLEMIDQTVRKQKSFGTETEISFLDSTRAEYDFLIQAIKTAISAGCDIVTLCDSAGISFPDDMYSFLLKIKRDVPELENIRLSVECSDSLHMASACALACMKAGVSQLKTSIGYDGILPLKNFVDVLCVKQGSLDISCKLNTTVCGTVTGKIQSYMAGEDKSLITDSSVKQMVCYDDLRLSQEDSMETIGNAVKKLGYDLSADDLTKVYKEFRVITSKKNIGLKDLDVIVAAVAMRVPPTFTVKSYIINSGNILTSMAQVTMMRGDQEISGISTGDGPIDAAFLSIERIVGRHFELDHFQINSVTEGHEAMGSAVVRLRSRGRLYSGKGASTDIIGAGIFAYVDALNKIYYEEMEKE